MSKLRHWSHDGPTAYDSGDNYAGEDLSHLLVVPVSRNRDSGPLEESNFSAALALLGGESATVQVHNFGHWAVGWYEVILVDPADTTAVRTAEEIADRIDDYPVLDEDDYCHREWEDMSETWSNMSRRERIEILARNSASIFAARREEVPDNSRVQDRLRPG